MTTRTKGWIVASVEPGRRSYRKSDGEGSVHQWMGSLDEASRRSEEGLEKRADVVEPPMP
jgi:hypothetical protein